MGRRKRSIKCGKEMQHVCNCGSPRHSAGLEQNGGWLRGFGGVLNSSHRADFGILPDRCFLVVDVAIRAGKTLVTLTPLKSHFGVDWVLGCPAQVLDCRAYLCCVNIQSLQEPC